jgi:hypothetical protein
MTVFEVLADRAARWFGGTLVIDWRDLRNLEPRSR